MTLHPGRCDLCGSTDHRLVASFEAPPDGETPFPIPEYHRELWQCAGCAHVRNRHRIDLDALYEGEYRAVTYGDRLASAFERVMALPEAASDNRQRVRRITQYADAAGLRGPCTALDVGSGLAVFPAALREAGWQVTALDPDPVAVAHARKHAHVEAVEGDFLRMELAERFDLVTLNKVLEHVLPMDLMLRRAASLLTRRGFLYLEVPDCETALAAAGPGREEFFLEHYCAFSLSSLALLAVRAGLTVELIERVREPSGKFTLRAFARQACA